MNRCKDCGAIIENNSIRCPNCQEIRQAETFKTIAVVANNFYNRFCFVISSITWLIRYVEYLGT